MLPSFWIVFETDSDYVLRNVFLRCNDDFIPKSYRIYTLFATKKKRIGRVWFLRNTDSERIIFNWYWSSIQYHFLLLVIHSSMLLIDIKKRILIITSDFYSIWVEVDVLCRKLHIKKNSSFNKEQVSKHLFIIICYSPSNIFLWIEWRASQS